MVLYVVDLETTGIHGYPYDLILEIALVKINDDLSRELVYDTLISYPERYRGKIDSCWWASNSGVKFDDLLGYPQIQKVWGDITKILKGEKLTSWNVAFDLSKFLRKMEGKYGHIGFSTQKCPMWACGKQMSYKFGRIKPAKLMDAAKFYGLTPPNVDFHRAKFDTLLASDIIIEMVKRGHYDSFSS